MADGNNNITYQLNIDTSNIQSQLEEVQNQIRITAETAQINIQNSADEAQKSTEKSSKSLIDVKGTVKDLAVQAVTSAVDLEDAMSQFAASTGTSKSELDGYEQTLKNIYSNNYGESFDEIAGAMATVKQQMGDLDQASLQSVTESAFTLRDTFEFDISDSLSAADTLMSQFGLSSDEAMNLIAAGTQNGLNASGELLSNIEQYAGQFADAGLSADDMFKMMEQGAQSGTLQLDAAAGAMSSLSQKALEGSDSTRSAFESLGLNADDMAAKFAAGGDSAREAFDQTLDALNNLEDPLAQNATGAELFGSEWDGVGTDVVSQLASIEEGAYAAGDAMDSMKETQSEDVSTTFESVQRGLELILTSLGEALLPLLGSLLETVQPIVTMLGESLTPIFEQIGEVLLVLSEPLGTLVEFLGQILGIALQLVGEALTPILDLAIQILEPLMQLVQGILDPLMVMLDSLMEPFTMLIEAALQPTISLVSSFIEPLTSLVEALLPPIQSLFESLTPIIESLFSALTPLFEIFTQIADTIGSVLAPVLEIVAGVFANVFSGAISSVMSVLEPLIGVFQNLIDFITNIFKGNWEDAWESVKKIFGNVWEAIKNLFKAPINWIIDGINGFLGGINSLKIPDWVPVVGGKGFNIPLIPRLQKGEDFIMSNWQPAFLDYGERVLTRAQNLRFMAMGGLEGMESALSGELLAHAAQPVVVHSVTPVYLDGKLISSNVTQHQFDAVKVRRFK